MARVYITLTSGTSWTVPSDWNNSDNVIHAIGGGGGGDGSGSAGQGDGAGGGAYARLDNHTLTPGASVSYSIGAFGVRGTASSQGSAGGDTTFDGSNLVAHGGMEGNGAIDTLDDSGGQPVFSTGDVKYEGGSGRGANSSTQGGAGGGAAGKSGAGGDALTYNISSERGGDPGAGGALNPNDGAGPGRGGNCAPNGAVGDQGDNYGGGGGGGASSVSKGSSTMRGGHGAQGVIVIEYEPYTAFPHTKVEIVS